MTRIEHEAVSKPVVVVSRKDYEADRQRGFCILEYSPAGEMVLTNPRNPAQAIRRPVPAVYMLRCMHCLFDVVESDIPPSPSGEQRTAMGLMKQHLFRRDHPWAYSPFQNPYGNVDDVIIEGVEDYTKEIT